MNKTRVAVMYACGIVYLCLLAACSTMDLGMITGKPSFNPASFGTEALKDRIRSPEYPVRDGVAAAKELANRNLSTKDGKDMLTLLTAQRDADISIALLNTMKQNKMNYLKVDLIDLQQKMTSPEAAVQCAATVSSFIEDDGELITYLSGLLLNSTHGHVRARSARLLASYGSQVEDTFIQALAKEKSASASFVMCESLKKGRVTKAYAILSEIANTVDRKFDTDNYFGNKVTAEMVRAIAVSTVEEMKAARDVSQ